MFTAPGRCASRYRSGESVSTTLMPPLRSSLAFRSCVEIVSSILISSKISLLGYTVLRRLRCKYGAIILRMASVLQIAPPDAIRRIRRVQTVTIAWMIVEALVSLFAAWRARSSALLAFGGDSAIELFSAIVVLWRFRAPAHEEAERWAARVAGALLFAL